MEDLTSRMCWELVEKEGYIAIWQKPLNNSCYLSRDSGVQPSLCDADNNPDNIWYFTNFFVFSQNIIPAGLAFCLN